MKYIITTEVSQIITKEISLAVVASSEEEAQHKAEEALQTFPKEVYTPGVERILTEDAEYDIPYDIKFKEIVIAPS